MSVFPKKNGTERHYPVSSNREVALEGDLSRQLQSSRIVTEIDSLVRE